MDEHAPFLRAIIERPDDDYQRLEYADFLNDADPATGFPRDPERAAFIRLQIELAKLPSVLWTVAVRAWQQDLSRFEVISDRPLMIGESVCGLFPDGSKVDGLRVTRAESRAFVNAPIRHEGICEAGGRIDNDHARRDALRRRERELLSRNPAWAMPDFPGVGGLRRGFVETWKATAADWLQHGDAICGRTPIAEVTLTTVPGPTETHPNHRYEPPSKRLVRLVGCKHWHPFHTNVEPMLRAEWPRVKTWNLPRDIDQIIAETRTMVDDNLRRSQALLDDITSRHRARLAAVELPNAVPATEEVTVTIPGPVPSFAPPE